MTEIPKCPTCSMRPSERIRAAQWAGASPGDPPCATSPCQDPCHDLADLGPAAVALLREWMATPRFETYADYQAWEQDFLSRVNPLLAAAPEVKP